MSRLISPRAVLSMVLVLTHLAGAWHMAVVPHTLSATGAIVEVEHHDAAGPGHAHGEGSLCARGELPDDAWAAADSCEAVVSARGSARPSQAPVTRVEVGRRLVTLELRAYQSAWAPPPLVVAPKSSPPAQG
jgi:hypothetical protein